MRSPVKKNFPESAWSIVWKNCSLLKKYTELVKKCQKNEMPFGQKSTFSKIIKKN
jgi:hypothetical protein